MNRIEATEKLKQVFDLPAFYDDQWTTIERLFNGERVLLIEKTGFGKSLCFQFPATQFSGVTIIFSPLIALMRDQVTKLKSLGIQAEFISHQRTPEENDQTIKDALAGRLKLLYIHPARLENAEWLKSAAQFDISMIVVDEAHCISTWGHDFIPAYRKIVELVNLLPLNFPVLATTATATKRVENDITKQIGKNISAIRGNLLRSNFGLYVVKVSSEDEKMIWLGKNLERISGTGLVYTGTRINTEIYARWFSFLKINSVHYNSGIDTETKKEIEQGLMANKYKCVVSTNALGMGIDKPDIRFIIHTQIPVSPIHYYQEIGRAGRDGKPANIVVFYNPEKDKQLPLSFIENGRPAEEKYHDVIKAVKEELLGLHGIIRATNLKQNQVKVILADLIDQGIVVKADRKYEYKFDAPDLNTQAFIDLRDAKLAEFDKMLEYINLSSCRMQYLCGYLGDDVHHNCEKCDNDTNKNIQVHVPDEWTDKLADFRGSYFPVLKVEGARTKLINGIAASFYDVSSAGETISRCKQNGQEFPDWLLRMTIKSFYKHYQDQAFDMMLFVPAATSIKQNSKGKLVTTFAEKLAQSLKIPLSTGLIKIRETASQRSFQTSILKKDNVKGAFAYQTQNEIKGKRILLFDDIFDSGTTIKEIGQYLSKQGAEVIAPLVIAKMTGGS